MRESAFYAHSYAQFPHGTIVITQRLQDGSNGLWCQVVPSMFYGVLRQSAASTELFGWFRAHQVDWNVTRCAVGPPGG